MQIRVGCLYELVAPLLPASQFGLQRAKLTTTQLICYLDHVYEGIDTENAAGDVEYLPEHRQSLRDFWEHHTTDQLSGNGVGGKLLGIIEEYLSNRQPFVEVNICRLSLLIVLGGLPQVSLLAPLLFLINVIDFPEGLKCQLFRFEDDTKLLSIHPVGEKCKPKMT